MKRGEQGFGFKMAFVVRGVGQAERQVDIPAIVLNDFVLADVTDVFVIVMAPLKTLYRRDQRYECVVVPTRMMAEQRPGFH